MFESVFKNRIEAAKKLVFALEKYKDSLDTVVLGLVRGGLVPAHEVAKALKVPLDFVIVRKLGVPGNPELAMGALTEDAIAIFDTEILTAYTISQDIKEKAVASANKEIARRVELYRKDYPKRALRGKTAIIVDDGIATGTTVRAAIGSCRSRGAKKIIVAVPVCPTEALTALKNDADEILCIHPSDTLFAVGAFYEQFPQIEDGEVLRILQEAKKL